MITNHLFGSICAFALLASLTVDSALGQAAPTPTPVPPVKVKVICNIAFLDGGSDPMLAFPTGRTCSVGVTFAASAYLIDRVASCVVKGGTYSCSTEITSPIRGARPVSAWVAQSVLTDDESISGCIPARGYPRATVSTPPIIASGYFSVSAVHRYSCPLTNR